MTDDFVFWLKSDNKVGSTTNFTEYAIELTDLRIGVVKTLTVDPIFNHFYNSQKDKIPEIPFTRNMIRTYTKTEGITDLGHYNFVEQNQLPETVYVVFVKLDAYNGARNMNPFNFEYIELAEASLLVNNKHEPMRPLKSTSSSHRKRHFYEHFLVIKTPNHIFVVKSFVICRRTLVTIPSTVKL